MITRKPMFLLMTDHCQTVTNIKSETSTHTNSRHTVDLVQRQSVQIKQIFLDVSSPFSSPPPPPEICKLKEGGTF